MMATKSIFFSILLLLPCAFAGVVKAEEALTWQDCVREAQKNHPDLISAQENIKQFNAAKSITTSGILPQISSSVGMSRAGTTTTTSGKTTKKTANSYSYGVSGSQLLFDGFKTRDKVMAASENIKAAGHGYKFTSSEVRLRLRTAFVNLLKFQELLNITREIYDIRKSNLDLITLRYQSGIEHKGALLTAQANLAQSEFESAQAKRSLEVSQRELVKEIGRTKFAPLQIEGRFKVTDAALDKPDFEAIAEKNPSVEKLIAQTKAAFFSLKAVRADFFPEISAQAGASKSEANWPPENNQWNAGLTLTFPIFEGGLRMAQVSQAEAVYRQAQEDERSARDGVIVALQQAWASLQDAAENVDVRKKFLDAAEERANIAESQYSLGLLQFDNWTIIEDDLVSAKKSFLNTQANALLAEANWIQAKGETLEYAQ